MYTTTQTTPRGRSRFSIVETAGRAWRAAAGVIGTGQATRPDPLASLLPAGAQRYLRASRSPQGFARIGTDDRVLVVGTGAVAVNVVKALERQRHRGMIRLTSHSGLLPQHLAELRAAGRLEVWVGRIQSAAAYDDKVVVDFLLRGRKLHSSERYDWVVDCT
jgi:uncharacterized NAD(P)/FAD-binding protein YdhS